MRRTALGSLMVLGLIAGSSSAAFAGETTGQGNDVPRHGQPASECAFSGQDLPDGIEGNPPGYDDDDVTTPGKSGGVPSGTRVQSYGQIVAAGGKAFVPSPGVACRGNGGE